jgi:tetratricopeptide (TPR) repeat protein
MFRLLVGGSRTALPRQQTLRALIDWSYDLLSDEEKRLLQFASVFVGGWTLEALEFVADEPNTLELLEQLVNKSLVVTEEHEGEMRYFLLETIRQYGREKLFEAKQASVARDRHFIYFDELSGKMWDAFRALKGFLYLRDQGYNEFENMRVAMEWGMANHPETVLHLAGNYAVVSSWTGSMVAGLDTVNRAIARFRELPPVQGDAQKKRQILLAKALFALGMVSIATGNVQLSRQALEEAIAITRVSGDRVLRGYAHGMYYTSTAFIDGLEAAEHAEECHAIFTEIDDLLGRSIAYMNMARVAQARGDYETSEKFFGLLKAKMKEAPVSLMTGMTYLGVGYGERGRGRLDVARRHFEEGLKVFTQLRHKGFMSVMHSEMGHIDRIQGRTTEAEQIYRETILNFQELGNRPAVAHQLECFAAIAIAKEEPERAVKLFGAAEALREVVNSQMTEWERVEYGQSMAQLRPMLPEAEFNVLWAEGRAMTMEQAIQFALVS